MPAISSVRDQIAEVFSLHRKYFVALAKGQLTNRTRHEADDIVQDAFVSAVEQSEDFRAEASLKSWIGVMVIRTAWRRNSSREPSSGYYDDLENVSIAAPGNIQAYLEHRQILGRVLPSLSQEQRLFISQWMDEERTGPMDGPARTRLHRAKARIRKVAIQKGVVQETRVA